MKKEYPPVVMTRKRLVFVAAIALLLMVTLVIYNLWGENPHASLPLKSSERVPDTANAADVAWFQDEKIADHPTLILNEKTLAHPLPAAFIKTRVSGDEDEQAMETPIASNQIVLDAVEKPKTVQNQNTSALQHALRNLESVYTLKTGTIIPATLISGINSDLPGPILAQVRENVYDTAAGRYLLIPQGAKLQGVYDASIVYGQQRVLISWQQLIFPNGQSLELAGMPGTDVSGYSGFQDRVNNHYPRLFGSTALLSLLSAGLQLSQPQQSSNNNSPSINQLLAQNLGINLSQTSEALLQKNMNIPPTLEIRPGYLFNVSITQDIAFPSAYPGA